MRLHVSFQMKTKGTKKKEIHQDYRCLFFVLDLKILFFFISHPQSARNSRKQNREKSENLQIKANAKTTNNNKKKKNSYNFIN